MASVRFHRERAAVLINTRTGEARLLAAEATFLPFVARDWVAMEWRTLIVSLAGEPLRAPPASGG